MIDYTKVEDYDCPSCTWSLHVDPRVWNEVSDHTPVLAYIQLQVKNHDDNCRGKDRLFPINKDISIYNSPYIGYTDSDSLKVIE